MRELITRPAGFAVSRTGRSFDDLLKACKFNRVDPSLTVQNFPVSEEPKEFELVLRCFPLSLYSHQAVESLKQLRLSPATLDQFLEFGAKFPSVLKPEKKSRHPVIILGSPWLFPGGSLHVPVVCYREENCELDIYGWDSCWGKNFYYAATFPKLSLVR